MSDVFISYSRKNSAFARRLIDRLNLAGKDAWVDWEGIPLTAPNWWGEIKAGIDGSDSFVFILSPDSMASVVCNMELDYAIELRKRIVPVVYQEVKTREAFASIADYTPDEAMEERLAGKDPLLIARDNWQRLSHINWVFFRDDDDFDAAFETLVTTVETDLEYVKAHTRYLVRAQEWQRENQRADLLLFGSEIDRAEAWLEKGDSYAAAAKSLQDTEKEKVVNPLPDSLHREYVQISREEDTHRRRLLRNLRIGTLIFAVVGVSAVLVAAATFITSRQVQSQSAIVEEIVSGFATIMLQQGDNPAGQIAAINALVQRYPDQSRAWLSRGQIYAVQNNTSEAIANYTEAIRLDPNYANAYYSRGIAQYEQGDFEGAIADYTEAIRIDPDDSLAYNNRGNARQKEGDNSGAIVDYTEAIRLAPADHVAYFNRGLVWLDMNDLGASINDFSEAIRLAPALAEGYFNRAIAYFIQSEMQGIFARNSNTPTTSELQALADWREAERLGYTLPPNVLEAITEIEAKLDVDNS